MLTHLALARLVRRAALPVLAGAATLALSAAALVAITAPALAADTATINGATTFQTMAGFGATPTPGARRPS